MCFYRNIFIIFAVGFLMTLAPSVVGRDVSVIQGETGVLLCSVIDTNYNVSQISWEKRTRGHPQDSEFVTITPGSGLKVINGGGDRVKFIGNIDDKNGSLELSGITLMDEGIYTCAFTLYPSGTQQKMISLNVVVPPVSSLVDNHPVLGDKEVSLATCTAAGSKPPATVSWLFGDLPGDLTTISNAIEHHNGTETTFGSLVGVPSRELDQQLVQCVVTSKATKDQTLPFTIQIYFPPSEVNINEQPDGSFSCDTAAKPKPEIVWTRIDGSWPESSVTVKDGRLKFLTMDASLNGLYQCEASNEYGSKYGRLYVHNNAEDTTATHLSAKKTTKGSSNPVGNFLYLLVCVPALLVCVLALTVCLWRKRVLSKNPVEDQFEPGSGGEVTTEPQMRTTSWPENRKRSRYVERLNSIYGL
ncbi:nectin-1-like isoform X3 [Takifugu flavidus]|uniref:nectin-1-like isoform X3 n=1 Tax=Takifugu flavidus TaxID=433684 RepID=UPI002544C87E|nr:nectin-1-like isoform X3 [Takifugu flavidus]